MGDQQPIEPSPPSLSASNAGGDGGDHAHVTGPSGEAVPKVVTVYASSSSIIADAYKKLAFSLGEVRRRVVSRPLRCYLRVHCFFFSCFPLSALGAEPAMAAPSGW